MRTVADTDSMPGLADLIAERHRRGLDGHDEMWDGVYHVAPRARAGHGDVQGQLQVVLAALTSGGLVVSGPVNIGLGEQDHRVPDLVVLRERTNVVWVPTAAMVVEVRSPGDETYEKFGFYHARGVEEILVADVTERAVRLFVRATQAYDQVDTSVVLGADVACIAERLVWPE